MLKYFAVFSSSCFVFHVANFLLSVVESDSWRCRRRRCPASPAWWWSTALRRLRRSWSCSGNSSTSGGCARRRTCCWRCSTSGRRPSCGGWTRRGSTARCAPRNRAAATAPTWPANAGRDNWSTTTDGRWRITARIRPDATNRRPSHRLNGRRTRAWRPCQQVHAFPILQHRTRSQGSTRCSWDTTATR